MYGKGEEGQRCFQMEDTKIDQMRTEIWQTRIV